MEPREIKGLEIAAKLKLVRSSGNIWYVPSQSNKQEKYTVALDDENPQCTCRDYEIRNRKCKHIFAVEYAIERENTADGQTVVTETVKVTRKNLFSKLARLQRSSNPREIRTTGAAL